MLVPAVARFILICTAGGRDLCLLSNNKLLSPFGKTNFFWNDKYTSTPPHFYFLHQMEDSKQCITDIFMMLNCMAQKHGGEKKTLNLSRGLVLGNWSSFSDLSSLKSFLKPKRTLPSLELE